MDRDDDVTLDETVRGGDARVVDLLDTLHFEVVVARAERAHLAALPLLRERRDVGRHRAGHAAVFLDVLEVLGLAVALRDGPAGAARQHRVELIDAEADLAFDADAGRNVAQQRVGELPGACRNVVSGQVGAQAADAA